MMANKQRYLPTDYPIVVYRLGAYLRFTNYDFGFEVFEKIFPSSPDDQCVQIALGIRKIHEKIAPNK